MGTEEKSTYNESLRNRSPKCTRCRNHGKISDLKGHKHQCPWKECNCNDCLIVAEKQRVTAARIALYRHQTVQGSISRGSSRPASECRSDNEGSMGGERSPQNIRMIKQLCDSSDNNSVYIDDMFLRSSTSSITPTSTRSPITADSTQASHVETLHYIFPFYHRSTLEAILDDCNYNLLQSVLRISQDVLSFPAPFGEGDNMSRLQHRISLFTSTIDNSDGRRPDCCSSPYCPKQMAYDWARQCEVPNVHKYRSYDYAKRVGSDLSMSHPTQKVKRHHSPDMDMVDSTTVKDDRHVNDSQAYFQSTKRFRYDLEYKTIGNQQKGIF